MNNTQQPPSTTPRRVWKRPEVKRLGTLAELTRTVSNGEYMSDQVTGSYYMS